MRKVLKTMACTLCAALCVMMFAACNDDHSGTGIGRGGNGTGSTGTGKQPTKITVVSDGFTDGMATLSWQGSKLTRVDVAEVDDGTFVPIGYGQPNYDAQGNLQDVLVWSYEESSGASVTATYLLDKLVGFMFRGERLANLEYNNTTGELVSITVDDERMSLAWTGNNITSAYNDEGYITLRYDNSLMFPFNDVLASLLPGWNKAMNCPTSITSSEGETISINYQRSGNYPTVLTYTEDGYTAQLYFEYGDGTGAPAPAPVNTTWVYFYPSWDSYDYGYVTDQDGNRNTDVRVAVGSTITLYANAYSGHRFVGWEDGNTDNPRRVTITRDGQRSFYAMFE